MAFINKSGLLARYEDKELILDYSKKAPTLREAIIFLHDAGILEEMIKDSREFSRTSPYEFTDHVGMSGSIDYYIRWYTSKGEFKGIRKTKLLVHISMSDKLNEGIHCFGPDLIAWLWYEPSINTYEILSMPKQVVYPLEVPDDTYPTGKTFFFPIPEDYKRMGELKDLIDAFREESNACLFGTLEFINSGCTKVPEDWLEKLSSETRGKIESLTEKDWMLLHEVAKSLSDKSEDPKVEEVVHNRRRYSSKARINTSEVSEEVAPIEE
jgi:hypothetical protein